MSVSSSFPRINRSTIVEPSRGVHWPARNSATWLFAFVRILDVARAFQVTRIKVECFRNERFVKARTVNPKNFFAELKRRNVYKVAIAYAIVAWLLMQVASQIFPFFEIPNWAVRLVVLLLILGFPIALILAWAFELTPEGIKRAEDVDLSKSVTR